MKVDTVDQRQKVLNALIKKSLKMDEILLHDSENTNDWVANMEILKSLISLEEMIRTEKIFLDTLDEMADVHTRNHAEKETYMEIVEVNLNYYISTILMHLLEHTFDTLDDWQFKTEAGKKFHKEVGKKLGAVLDKYQDLYII